MHSVIKLMSTERRQQARKVPRDFTYIRVGEDSGGRVLNVSERGLCFEALSAIRYTESFPFWLSFNLIDRIDGEGTVVWVDTAKRTAGIRFMDLSEYAREQIRSWMNESVTEEMAPSEEGSQMIELPLGGSEVAELSLSALESPEPVPQARFANAAEGPAELAVSAEAQLAEQDDRADWDSLPARVTAEDSELTELVPLRRYLTTARMQFVRGILVGVAAGAVIVLPLFKYMSLRQRDTSVEIPGATTTTVNAGSLTDAQAPKAVLEVPKPLSFTPAGSRVRTNGSSQSRGNPVDPVFGTQNPGPPGSSAAAPAQSAVQRGTNAPGSAQLAASSAPATGNASAVEKARPAAPPSAAPVENSRQPAPVANRVAQRTDESGATVTASTVNTATPAVGAAAVSPEVRRGKAATPAPLGGDVRPPKLVKSTTPAYPPLARTQRVSGDVQVDAVVDTTGKVDAVKILSGPLLLQRAAADAIRQWKYAPGMLDGTPTPMHVTVVMKFRIPTQ